MIATLTDGTELKYVRGFSVATTDRHLYVQANGQPTVPVEQRLTLHQMNEHGLTMPWNKIESIGM